MVSFIFLILFFQCYDYYKNLIIVMNCNRKMYYSMKTESFDQQNCHPNEFYQHPTISQGIIANDLALQKAIQMIEQLKQNLSLAIRINQTLTLENEHLKSNLQKITQKINSDTSAWQCKLSQMEQQKSQFANLLQQIKLTLQSTEHEYNSSKSQIQKLTKIISQQKRAYSQLEHTLMNQSLHDISSPSLVLAPSDLNYLTQLQHQNTQLQLQLKRNCQQMQKMQGKITKLEKQNGQIKKWMAGLLGLSKIVQGSERVVMEEIWGRVRGG